MHSVFVDVSLVLSLVIGVALLMKALRQPMIIAYLLTGVICGPVFLNLINSSQDFFDVFADFGVILLLFLVGLSLNMSYLKKIGKVAVVTGIGQVVFTSLFGLLILLAFGFSFLSALFVAISITFSSTIIITKLLSDKGDEKSVYGRYTIGLMLVQDVVAIGLMIFLPALALGDSLINAVALILIKSILLFLGVYLITKFILPLVLDKAAESGEFLLLFSLAWCFAVAGASHWAGLSLEVGAIIAGLSLAASNYRTEISSRIKPLRDFFIALFFIILGSEMQIESVKGVLWPSVWISMFILIGNPLILYVLYRTMRFTRKNSFLAGLTAAQVSEFGFVFLFVSRDLGFVGKEELSMFTIVALITIFVSSYLITYNYQLFRKIKPWLDKIGKEKRVIQKDDKKCYDVIVFGYHRLGWQICRALQELEVSFAVVDFDPIAIHKLKKKRVPCFFGDAFEQDFLQEMPLNQAKLVISTLPNAEEQVALSKELRKSNKRAIFIGNLSHTAFLEDLYEAGADYVMVPHLIGGRWMAQVLKGQKWTRQAFKKLRNKQKKDLKPID
ncbi:MAG: cation:proton antiporter [Candidatus Moraniibacteriota bacterium]